MNSVQKVYMALEELENADDEELAGALPVPVPIPMLRGLIPMIARQVPERPAELDDFLTKVGDFCHSLRSDHEPAAA